MQVQWKKLLARTLIWLVAEICLSFLGLDHLADYDELLTQISNYECGSAKVKSRKSISANIVVELL